MVEKTYIIVGMEMKGMDVLYKKQILTFTRFWGDNRLCLYAKIQVKLVFLKWNLSVDILMNGAYLLTI